MSHRDLHKNTKGSNETGKSTIYFIFLELCYKRMSGTQLKCKSDDENAKPKLSTTENVEATITIKANPKPPPILDGIDEKNETFDNKTKEIPDKEHCEKDKKCKSCCRSCKKCTCCCSKCTLS